MEFEGRWDNWIEREEYYVGIKKLVDWLNLKDKDDRVILLFFNGKQKIKIEMILWLKAVVRLRKKRNSKKNRRKDSLKEGKKILIYDS